MVSGRDFSGRGKVSVSAGFSGHLCREARKRKKMRTATASRRTEEAMSPERFLKTKKSVICWGSTDCQSFAEVFFCIQSQNPSSERWTESW